MGPNSRGHVQRNRDSFSAVLRRLSESIGGHLGGTLGDYLRWALTNRNVHFQLRQAADNRVLRECELCRRDYRAEESRCAPSAVTPSLAWPDLPPARRNPPALG